MAPTTHECDNVIRNAYFASIHFISKALYDQMIELFFDDEDIADPVLKTRDDIGYNVVSCESHYIRFGCDDAVYNHADVELGPVVISDDEQLVQPVAGQYSVQFFRGLEYLFPDGEYYFSKARTLEGEFTLVIMVKVKGKAIYYGDLTNMFP